MKGTIIGTRAVLAVGIPAYRDEIVLREAHGEQKTQIDRMEQRID